MNRAAAVLTALLALAPFAVEAQQPAPAAAPPAAATPAAPANDRPLYQVEGFRSARFGMAEAALREAINRDFPRAGTGAPRRTAEIDLQNNRVHRTTSLVITVRELMPDTGLVRIEYILGFQTRQLIQVNLIWGTPIEPSASLESVTTPAARLQSFFVQENFPDDRRLINAMMQDGTQLLFRGRDAEGRTVELVAGQRRAGDAAQPGQPAQGQPAQGQAAAHWLRLSYVLNPERPDVYSLRRGEF